MPWPCAIAQFEAEPHWREALALRQWEDLPGLEAVAMEQYRSLVQVAAGSGQ